ncbi:hypothetical protein [Lacticaseibacillus suibinensis]|uniref:hypothetical protein n=1 Tax=Lacticaseibacillus suibinensis TaxID=2486011 RepID=UPI000F7A9238|nr:hypothetical protein [Lacticaseibacillus suibinensis]
MEKLVLESSVVKFTIEIENKNDGKVTEVVLGVDFSDEALIAEKAKADLRKNKLAELEKEYSDLLDQEVTDDNVKVALEAWSKTLQMAFDTDFGAGTYDKIAAASGGNSFINFLLLYQRINQIVSSKIEAKLANIQRKSENRKARYLKNRKRR